MVNENIQLDGPKQAAATFPNAEPMAPRSSPLYVALAGAVILAAAVFLLKELAPLFSQLFMAVFLFYLVYPIHRWLVRHHVPRLVSYGLISLLMLVVIAGVGGLVTWNLNYLIANLPTYERAMDQTLEQVAGWVPGMNAEELRVAVREANWFRYGLTWAQTVSGTAFGVFGYAGMVVVFLVILMLESGDLDQRVEKGFGEERGHRILEGAREVRDSVSSYIQVCTLCNLLAGGLTSAVLYWFGVDGAIFWGFLGFLLPYILYVGPILAAALPGLFALITLENMADGLIVLGLLSAGQFLAGTVIQPLLVGQRLKLSPLMILISLVFWGLLLGIAGMVLAAPLLVTLRAVLASFPGTRPLATLISQSD